MLAALSRAETLDTADQLAGEVFCCQDWMASDGRTGDFVRQLTAHTADEDPGIRDEAQRLLHPASGERGSQ